LSPSNRTRNSQVALKLSFVFLAWRDFDTAFALIYSGCCKADLLKRGSRESFGGNVDLTVSILRGTLFLFPAPTARNGKRLLQQGMGLRLTKILGTVEDSVVLELVSCFG
jgi:hypothetical protein